MYVWQQTLQCSSDEDERGTGRSAATMATTRAWVDEDDVTRSDSLTVLIESDPIATAAVVKEPSSIAVDVPRAQQEVLLVSGYYDNAAHHGNSSTTANSKLTNTEDTQKLLS